MELSSIAGHFPFGVVIRVLVPVMNKQAMLWMFVQVARRDQHSHKPVWVDAGEHLHSDCLIGQPANISARSILCRGVPEGFQ
jgi:hypothetical protein